ncbi:trimethylamine-n-oxide reductase 1 [Campylobacter sputorum subsp. bubulus]|uniref:peptidylprolyl isomerase n=1 Tax=Campylobacter sputorum subsp. sputorum TaxID=32024 RepID=A0A381DGN8_9BACT|nr:peptidylprolyl isomerase [Campylobacter sputorum]ASM34933.1 SurA-like chaperone / peptidyl-prolyl cis-trans isomerase [Campylobacter sputorum aubsp. sputorum RM3237]KAB0581938.1 peptidylprolyl isomerase [Campylobacter sputorum subsp. sputorum]QEL05124.1 major antigenic peptide / PpiC-type peptidyl-prolyl cis-trans isomerase [Campylobacter sputorum subsp. sputorum]SUX09438.1 trimethylamine-n-oxide reductase 1 [Campylobacter sputorum subsp. sputorum]SUX30810.1 trimethylamine-n-oxide reductase
MKKLVFTTLSLATAISLNAAVLATVNGQDITSEELEAIPGIQLNKMSPEHKKQLIDQAIEYKLIVDDAKKTGIQKEPEYTKSLKNLEEKVMADIYMKKIFDGIKVSDADIKKFYDTNKDRLFKRPGQSKAKHILFALDNEKGAKDAIKSLQAFKGKDLENKFAELAKEKSIDGGSARQGGELGWFEKSKMVKPFADAVESLKKGELTKNPVKSQFGYHVILKEDERPEGTIPYNDVKDEIENSLKLQQFKGKMQGKIQDLKQKAKITYSK